MKSAATLSGSHRGRPGAPARLWPCATLALLLAGCGDDHVRKYEAALQQGKALVVLTGEPSALAEGRAELLASSAERVVIHAENADTDRVDA